MAYNSHEFACIQIKQKGIDFDVPFVEHWHVNGFKKVFSPFFENITTSNYGGI